MAGEAGPNSVAESSLAGHGSGNRDEDPLIEGEERDVRSRLKEAFKGFFKGFRSKTEEPHTDEPSSSSQSSDEHAAASEGGEHSPLRRHSSAQSLTAEHRETRRSEGDEAGRLRRDLSSQSLGHRSPLASSDSQGSSSSPGLLNNLWRLGEAAIPQPSRNSAVNATCLICLEPLSPEEFHSGEAIVLDCECRGDVAMRHRSCVEKWTHVKGNRTCDICKTLIKNLPDPPPRAPETASSNGQLFDDGELLRNNAQFIVDQAPTGTDLVFDCIRVTWIAMIISILFFGMDIANALWTGAIVGLGYTVCVRAMYQYQLRMYLREQQRERDVEEGQPQAVVVV